MTTPATADMKPRRWLLPRFSLKVLMLAVTAAAIGSAVWWRWPITVLSEKRYGSSVVKETSTYHRGLRGDLIKHGVYRRTINGKLELEGEWFEGELGKCEYRTGSTVLTYEFKDRKLIAAPHAPRDSLLMQRMADRSNKSVEALWGDVDLDYAETPLKEVVGDLSERFHLCLAMYLGRKELYQAPVVLNVKWPLRVGFDAVLSPLGLVLDYRYGVLCIVDADEAEDWQDATGVMKVQPSPEAPLAQRLDAPAKVTPIELRPSSRRDINAQLAPEVPMRDVLKSLAADQDISVQLRLTEEDWVKLDARDDGMLGLPSGVFMIRSDPRTIPARAVPITLRQLLGLLLDKAELHCREENGALIIEPQQKATAGPAHARVK
jgi:hypothetical protein